jgi:hypothetical protein
VRVFKARSSDFFASALGVVVLITLALFLADRRPWWQTYPGVAVGAVAAARWVRQGMRARSAERAAQAPSAAS